MSAVVGTEDSEVVMCLRLQKVELQQAGGFKKPASAISLLQNKTYYQSPDTGRWQIP